MATWSTQQLVEFLAGISGCIDERSATRDAVERAAEALEAEAAAVITEAGLVASTGFPSGEAPAEALGAVARGESDVIEVPGVGLCVAAVVALDAGGDGWFVVARGPDEPFSHEDISVFRGMARVLSLTLRQLRLIDSERQLRAESEREASERRAAQKELAHLAHHDALTSLPNRTLLLERLNRALQRARREGTMVGVLFVDLDNFKLINDTLGHHVGDELLCQVAARLRDSVRVEGTPGRVARDTVARFGGDEFVVVGEGLASAQDAQGIGARIAERLSEPCLVGGEQLFVTASTGVVLSDGNTTPHSLIRDADAAMYHAKARGRARIEVFDDVMRDRLLERLGHEQELRQAIERGEFTLVYQPIFSIRDEAIVGAEALIRWAHPERGLLAPCDFIPLAEETGLIVQIDEWVLNQACAQLSTWQSTGKVGPDFAVSVNLSARQVEDGRLLEVVQDALNQSGVRPSSLGLEITETVLIENTDSPIAVLDSLRALGARLILDDFGTGYSSLSYLQRFPLDALKLDRSFMSDIAQPGRDRNLVAALLHLAEVLDLSVVVEGVETEPQLSSLRELGCQFVQGFLLSVPLRVEELEQRLAAVSRLSAAA